MGFFDDLADAASDGVEAIGDAAEEAAEDIADAAEDFVEDVSDTAEDVGDAIEQGMEEGGLIGGFVGLVTGLVGGAVGIVGNFSDLLIEVTGAVIGGVISLTGAAIGGLARVAIVLVSGGVFADFGEDVGTFFTEGGRKVGEGVADGFNMFGDLVERLFDIVGGAIIRGGMRTTCLVVGLGKGLIGLLESAGDALSGQTKSSREPQGINRVEHFFVVMLENRSFDHMLGRLNLPDLDGVRPAEHWNVNGSGAQIHSGGDAKLALEADPPHEFDDVQAQLQGEPANGGFIRRFEERLQDEFALPFIPEDANQVMAGFTPERLPILNTLAREFAVCDRWFCSVPGPTLPNRLFALAGTSGGLADSPSNASMIWAMTGGGFEFDNGTIFDRIRGKCLEWRVYAGDLTPLVMTLKGMATENVLSAGSAIRSFADFANDLAEADGSFPRVTFIEPSYGFFWSTYEHGTSQHPLDSVVGGEQLIKDVYEAVRNSAVWERSALIVLYDENGGFYDHVEPPAARPPGDPRDYESWADSPAARAFQFDRLGIRVPAVVVSPLIPRGTVDHTEYDHTSLLRTIISRFGLNALTERTQFARTLDHLFSLSAPRLDAPVNLPPIFAG